MAEYPHMPLFVDAYLADTTHLSTTEHGAYMLLLMAAWRRPGCDLPDDDARLAKIARQPLANWLGRIRPVMAEFFQIEDGTWRQKRQTAIRNHVAAVSEKRRDAALSGVRARKSANPLPPQEPGPANAGANGSAAEGLTVPTRARNPNLNPKKESESLLQTESPIPREPPAGAQPSIIGDSPSAVNTIEGKFLDRCQTIGMNPTAVRVGLAVWRDSVSPPKLRTILHSANELTRGNPYRYAAKAIGTAITELEAACRGANRAPAEPMSMQERVRRLMAAEAQGNA